MDSSEYRQLPADLQTNLYNDITPNRLLAPGGSSAPPYAAKAEGHRRENDRWSTPSPHKTQLKSLTAAFASLTVIIFLILVCRSIRSRAHSWVVTRKLSNDGDVSDSDSDALVICEVAGEEGPAASDAEPLQVPLKPPKAKRAKVERGRRHNGARFLVEDESKSESDDDQPSTSAGRKRKRKARALFPEAPKNEGPGSPSRSEGELEAASALIELRQSLAAAGEVTLGAEELSVTSLRSDAPINGPPTSPRASQTLAPTLRQLLLQPVRFPLPSAPAGVLDTSTSSAPSSGGEEPSTSSAAWEDAVVSPGPRVHPYYHVPTVHPMHRGKRLFKRDKATNFGFAYKHYCSQLKRMRTLLGKETLGLVELDILGHVTAELLSYTYHYEHNSTKSLYFSDATRILGRRYLILDSVIAALHVLEEPPRGRWWERIMAVIPDDTLAESHYVSHRSGIGAVFQVELTKKLHKALRVLKSGTRPSKEDTIEIKRALFCSTHSPDNLKRPRWNPWREDDKNFDETDDH